MELIQNETVQEKTKKQDADYIFYELTRSIFPTCRRVIDGHILLRDNKVYMRKRCPEHGRFEGLIYSDAEAAAVQMAHLVHFQQADAEDLPFLADQFDAILIIR